MREIAGEGRLAVVRERKLQRGRCDALLHVLSRTPIFAFTDKVEVRGDRVSRHRHTASQQTSTAVHLDAAARYTLRRATAVPPLSPPFAIRAGGFPHRFGHATPCAAYAAGAARAEHRAAFRFLIVRAAG
jgi:hypothetical protein